MGSRTVPAPESAPAPFPVGARVVVERDEQRYPSRGTWPRYRGKVGMVASPGEFGEVGVLLGVGTVWFKPWELRRIRGGGTAGR